MYKHRNMTSSQLTEIGTTLFKDPIHWRSRLAVQLGYGYSQMYKFSQGKQPIPRIVALAVRELKRGWNSGG